MTRLAVVCQVFPWLTQTFTFNELRAWASEGLLVQPLALRRPAGGMGIAPAAFDEARLLPTVYVDSLSLADWIRGIGLTVKRPVIAARTLLLTVLRPYPTRNTARQRATAVWSWIRAVGISGRCARLSVDQLHADFADEAATVAWVASRLLAIPFSFRSHTSYNTQLIREKLRDASLVLCISDHDRRALAALSPADESKLVLSYLGVDSDRWSHGVAPRQGGLWQILSVGTLQEKKGQQYLIEACAHLRDRGIDFKCSLVGDGSSREGLEASIKRLRLEDRIEIIGYRPPADVQQMVRECDVFCLACVETPEGDSDGLPVVLMEAMAAGKAVVSTPTAGIPELIESGQSGMLVPARDALALASAIERLLVGDAERSRIGISAQERIRDRFNWQKNGKRSADLIRSVSGAVHT